MKSNQISIITFLIFNALFSVCYGQVESSTSEDDPNMPNVGYELLIIKCVSEESAPCGLIWNDEEHVFTCNSDKCRLYISGEEFDYDLKLFNKILHSHMEGKYKDAEFNITSVELMNFKDRLTCNIDYYLPSLERSDGFLMSFGKE